MKRPSEKTFDGNGRSRRTFIRESTMLGGVVVLGGTGLGVAVAQDDDDTSDGDETGDEDDTSEGTDDERDHEFVVRIENVSQQGALTPEGGTQQDVTLSPGVYAAFTGDNPLFTAGEQDRGEGLESLAEDGDPSTLAESLRSTGGVVESGQFDEPEDTDQEGPIGPGQAYEFDFDARQGSAFTFATMFIQSNDLFFAPGQEGIALYENGQPIDGDVTDQVDLWDAGTEENEAPGAGQNQPAQQSGPDTGPDEGGVVQPVSESNDGFSYPAVTDVIQVTVSSAPRNGGRDDDDRDDEHHDDRSDDGHNGDRSGDRHHGDGDDDEHHDDGGDGGRHDGDHDGDGGRGQGGSY